MNTNAKPLKLEVGKRYVRRNGDISEPVIYCGVTDYMFTCGECYYSEGGLLYRDGVSPLDLIAEYIEPQTVDRTVFGGAKVGFAPVPVPVVDKFALLKGAYRNGVKIEWKDGGVWCPANPPRWNGETEYRLKPEPIDGFADLKEAYAKGETIEWYGVLTGVWTPTPTPCWNPAAIYRIAPKPEVAPKPEWYVLLDKARKILGEIDSMELYDAITVFLAKEKP